MRVFRADILRRLRFREKEKKRLKVCRQLQNNDVGE